MQGPYRFCSKTLPDFPGLFGVMDLLFYSGVFEDWTLLKVELHSVCCFFILSIS